MRFEYSMSTGGSSHDYDMPLLSESNMPLVVFDAPLALFSLSCVMRHHVFAVSLYLNEGSPLSDICSILVKTWPHWPFTVDILIHCH